MSHPPQNPGQNQWNPPQGGGQWQSPQQPQPHQWQQPPHAPRPQGAQAPNQWQQPPRQQYAPNQGAGGAPNQGAGGAPKKPMGAGKIVLIIVGVLVALGLIIGLAVAVLGNRGADGGGDPDAGGTKGLAGLSYEEQATTLAQEYIDALVAKDVAKALELSGEPDDDTVALTTEAYAQALEAAPITDASLGFVEVDEAGLPNARVPLLYSVGGQMTDQAISMHDYDQDGVFELTAGIGATIDVPEDIAGLSLTVNGAEVPDGGRVLLLPGAYTVATASEYLTFVEDTLTVKNNGDSSLSGLEMAVTDAGKQAFRDSVKKAVDACLAEKTLAAGCGLDPVPEKAANGWVATEGTVTRSLSDIGRREIEKMEPTPRYDEPLLVEGSFISGYDYEVECTKDGQPGICEPLLGGTFGTPSVDLADPELPVLWE